MWCYGGSVGAAAGAVEATDCCDHALPGTLTRTHDLSEPRAPVHLLVLDVMSTMHALQADRICVLHLGP
jgi:hypothetical protein